MSGCHAGDRQECRRKSVAEGDGAGLVEQQHIHVASGFDGSAGRRHHVEPDQAIHAGDADRR